MGSQKVVKVRQSNAESELSKSLPADVIFSKTDIDYEFPQPESDTENSRTQQVACISLVF